MTSVKKQVSAMKGKLEKNGQDYYCHHEGKAANNLI